MILSASGQKTETLFRATRPVSTHRFEFEGKEPLAFWIVISLLLANTTETGSLVSQVPRPVFHLLVSQKSNDLPSVRACFGFCG
jgi:hypothetical protein